VVRAFGNLLVLLRRGYWRESLQSLSRRIWSNEVYLGLHHDLAVPFPALTSQVSLSLRPLREGDAASLLQLDRTAPSAADFHTRLSRNRLMEAAIPTCYVATTTDGDPCYLQWLIGPQDFSALQDFTNEWYPPLQEGDLLLEGAYTPERFRGKGIALSAVLHLADEAKSAGGSRLVTFIGEPNVSALRAYERLGFVPFVQRQERWRFFRRSLESRPFGGSWNSDPEKDQS